MKKAFISVNYLQIAFYIHNPDQDNTIFFIHGNSSSSGNWHKQVLSNALAGYRLITIDLPNHGNSDAIEADGDFSLPAIAKTIGAAIKQLINNHPYTICSISLGTNIVAEMLAEDFSPRGLLLAGPCIIGEGCGMNKMLLEGADVTAVFSENLTEDTVEKYALTISNSGAQNDLEVFLKDYYAVKKNFRSSLYDTIALGNYSDEIAIIQKLNVPVCVIFGKEERVVNTSYLDTAPINIWNNTIYKIKGASHFVNIDAPKPFNELLVKFAKYIFTKNAA